MSICERCGAQFHCAMADAPADRKPTGAADETPCWCTFEPPAVPVPRAAAASPAAAEEASAANAAVGCWCPSCLRAHIAGLKSAAPGA